MSEKEIGKIGYVPIERYQTDKAKVCETPRHRGLRLPASAVVAIAYEWDGEEQLVVQMVCNECWKVFDFDMNSPKWNLAGDGESSKTPGSS